MRSAGISCPLVDLSYSQGAQEALTTVRRAAGEKAAAELAEFFSTQAKTTWHTGLISALARLATADARTPSVEWPSDGAPVYGGVRYAGDRVDECARPRHSLCRGSGGEGMLLMVLGAGASYDSADMPIQRSSSYSVWRPPLARGLFGTVPEYAAILDTYPQVAGLVHRVREALHRDEDLEGTLESLRDEAGVVPLRRRQLLALQFYLRHLLRECGDRWASEHGGVTHYARLVDEIETWRGPAEVVYVTFNYDTLLEKALVGTKRLNCLADYATGPVRVIKPHGSVDWVRIVPLPDSVAKQMMMDSAPAERICDIAADLDLGLRFGKSSAALSTQQVNKRVLLPAIAIPTQTKTDYECPTSHVDALRRLLPDVDRVISIGWRGGEKHFLNLLGEGLVGSPPALVVTENAEACGVTAAALHACGIKRTYAYSNGFTGLVHDGTRPGGVLRAFLAGQLDSLQR